MNFQSVKRMAAAASVVVAAGALPLISATPASAAWDDCASYIASHGYRVGPKVTAACSHSALDTGIGRMPNPICEVGLVKIHVKDEVASAACRRA
ncbi:hypothetical protein [Streptomyces sp. NPDC002676]